MSASATLTAYTARPPDGRKPDSVVVLLHGVGANGHDLLGLSELWHDSVPGAEFVSPDAPFAYDMAPIGHQWFSLQERSLPAMVAGAEQAEPLLDRFLDEVLAERGLDDSRLALVGFSQGTMMALHVGLRRKRACAGILGYSGLLLATPDLAVAVTARPPVLLIHGVQDPVLPFQAMAAAQTALTMVGVAVETMARPALGHGIDDEGAVQGGRFLRRVLPSV